MSFLPRVSERTRERIAREFDDLGPEACMAEIVNAMRRDNPELLQMAQNCAEDVGEASKVMAGFGMFYRALAVEAFVAMGSEATSALPRVDPQTREKIVLEIDELGTEAFTYRSMDGLEQSNPELMQIAHRCAARTPDYLGVIQGFALLHRSLVVQCGADRSNLH